MHINVTCRILHTHICFTAITQVVLYYQAPLFKNWTICWSKAPFLTVSFTTTTTVLTAILSGTTWVSQYQKKHSPTHLFWSSSNLYQLLPSTAIHSILLVQFTCLTVFLHNFSPSPLWSTSWSWALHLILHTYISSPNQYLLFATHAHIIAACLAVVPRLSSVPSLYLNSVLGTLSFTFTSHIHLIILISARLNATCFLSLQARSHFHVAY